MPTSCRCRPGTRCVPDGPFSVVRQPSQKPSYGNKRDKVITSSSSDQLEGRMMPARHLFAILIAFLSCVGLESGMGQVQAPETAVVSASVAGSIASGNLSPVTVILESTASNPLANFDGYSTIVAEDGSFHFSDVAPGEYRLIATAKDGLYGEYGYRPHSAPGKTLQIKSADCIRDLSIELFPDPKAICGRIVNENGSPVEANVEVYSLYNSWAQL